MVYHKHCAYFALYVAILGSFSTQHIKREQLQFHPKKTTSLFFLFNIKGATDHSCLESCSRSKYKIITSTVASSSHFNYSYVNIYLAQHVYLLIILSSHYGCRHFIFEVFQIFWFKRGPSRVLQVILNK